MEVLPDDDSLLIFRLNLGEQLNILLMGDLFQQHTFKLFEEGKIDGNKICDRERAVKGAHTPILKGLLLKYHYFVTT